LPPTNGTPVTCWRREDCAAPGAAPSYEPAGRRRRTHYRSGLSSRFLYYYASMPTGEEERRGGGRSIHRARGDRRQRERNRPKRRRRTAVDIFVISYVAPHPSPPTETESYVGYASRISGRCGLLLLAGMVRIPDADPRTQLTVPCTRREDGRGAVRHHRWVPPDGSSCPNKGRL
jgi:hypothetical protein